MRTEDVLAASGTGMWSWDEIRGVVALDAVAAGLLGLPAEPVTLSEAAVRSRVPIQDYIELQRATALAEAEGGVAEVEFRIVTAEGEVQRTLRARVRRIEGQAGAEAGERPGATGILGTVVELPGAARRQAGAEDWDWPRAREAFVLDAGRALSEARTTEDVLRVSASLVMPGFSPDAIAIFAREGDRLKPIAYRGPQDDLEAMGFPLGLERDYPGSEVMRTGRAIYLSTPAEFRERYPEFAPTVMGFGRESWAYLPLVVGGRMIGVWMVAFGTHVDFSVGDRGMLSALARLLAQALSRTFLQDTERELSADLQHTMRPAPSPAVPGMQVAARYVPTAGGLQVGGDWYDVIPLPSGRVALIIGDVQGHDVRAAAVMAQLRIVLRAYASEGHHPDGVLARATRFLSALSADPEAGVGEARFATCLYAEIDPGTGTLEIARAGHLDPAMMLSDGTVVSRPTVGGLPLGIVAQEDYPVTRLSLQPGETLLLCTDGLVESGRDDLDTGWARVTKAVKGLSGLHVDDLADTLIETVQATSPVPPEDRDDIALLLLRRPAGAPVREGGPMRRLVFTVGQSEPDRVAGARAQLATLLHDWPVTERVFLATLLLSEVLTNVLRHTEGDALLVAELSGRPGERLLRVEVSDTSDAMPHLRHPGELASAGRGLLLLDALADGWGATPRGTGKTTWFELRESPTGRERPTGQEGPTGREAPTGREGS
ncbi:ATP-binding SpoIIE family protein phosphatase [Streptomyces hoynatensis]|uniref:protein-serine/threonine phosphatase n=1 Tax=Streptomyces hoynatensis TaxID=1141874 RepID=A0A3A9Z799_9ACTN|nr:SpoIIE family protein phosphatase [Streptomyces hoynatensis]RKN43126.1 phosphatase [Streptomyces hoynatensis]